MDDHRGDVCGGDCAWLRAAEHSYSLERCRLDRYGGKFQGLRLVPMSAALAWGLIPARALSQPRKFVAPTGRALTLFGYAISLDFHQRVQRPGAVT
jgi:hypothetical protein